MRDFSLKKMFKTVFQAYLLESSRIKLLAVFSKNNKNMNLKGQLTMHNLTKSTPTKS